MHHGYILPAWLVQVSREEEHYGLTVLPTSLSLFVYTLALVPLDPGEFSTPHSQRYHRLLLKAALPYVNYP